jgi:hypothetical protein
MTGGSLQRCGAATPFHLHHSWLLYGLKNYFLLRFPVLLYHMNPLPPLRCFSPARNAFPKNHFGQHARLRAVFVFIVLVVATSSALAKSPLVSVSVFPTSITNEGQNATFTFTLSSPAQRKISVGFVLTGTPGFNDFVFVGDFNSGRVVIPAGQMSASITLHSFVADFQPPIDTVILNLVNGQRYHLGAPDHAQLHIHNLP